MRKMPKINGNFTDLMPNKQQLLWSIVGLSLKIFWYFDLMLQKIYEFCRNIVLKLVCIFPAKHPNIMFYYFYQINHSNLAVNW
jgi:hypothetical protein